MSANDSASILRRRSFLLGAASVLTGCVANEAVDSLHSGGAAGWGGASGAAGNAGAAGSAGWGGSAGQGGSAGAAGSAGAGGAAGEAGADGGAAGAAGDAGGTRFPSVTAIPRIDAHVHIGRNDNTGLNNYLVVREKVLTETGADVALWIDLDSGKLQSWTTDPAGLSRLEQHGEGRMIPTYADFYPARGLALSAADIGPKHNMGYIGYKMHFGSHNKQVPTYPYINDAYFAPVLAAMQAAGMPLASIHLEGNWYESGGSDKQREALLQVAKSYPSLRIVIAHFGHHNAAGLGWFRDAMTACPNLHVDLSASIQHFYKFDHEDLRDLMILHADRFLYGTDNIDRALAATVRDP